MLVGGPLRGFTRALRISMECCLCSFVLGWGFFVAAGAILGGWESGVMAVFAGFAFVGLGVAFLAFPPALAANMVFVRIFRGRTWRDERWRPWTAGALAILFSGAVMALLGTAAPKPPLYIRTLFGELDRLVYFGGWFVLFSNLALLVAWGLPSRKR